VAAARGPRRRRRRRPRAVEAGGGAALAVAVAAAELAALPSADSLDLVGALPLARRRRLVGPARRLPAGCGGGGGGACAPTPAHGGAHAVTAATAELSASPLTNSLRLACRRSLGCRSRAQGVPRLARDSHMRAARCSP